MYLFLIKVIESEVILQFKEQRYSTQLVSYSNIEKPGVLFWRPMGKKEFDAVVASGDAKCSDLI